MHLLFPLLIGLAWSGATAATNPAVNCAVTTVYATVADPIKLAFAPDGTLFVGRDNIGSGGNAGDAVKIHRVGAGGSPVIEYGDATIPDPDAVAFDRVGIVSGTPGAVLVGGGLPGGEAAISRINPNGVVSALFGGAQMQMRNPGELLFDASGRLYISDSDSNQVLVTSSGAVPARLFSLSGAYAMAFDANNRLAVGSISDGVLRYYSTNGTFLGAGPAIKPGSPVVAGPGDPFWGRDLYAVNDGNQLIRIDSSGNATVVGAGFDGSLQMAFGPDKALYASYRDYDVILRIAPLANFVPAPAHWWRGDGNALDSIGTAHGTTNGGLSYVPGRVGQAFRVDGTTASVVEFGPDVVNFGTNDFTIAFWLRTTNTSLMNVLNKREGCNADSVWDINMGGGRVGLGINEGPGLVNYFTIGATNDLADNQWHHIAFVRLGATIRCYVDAVLQRERTTNFLTFVSNTAPVRVANTACAPFNPGLIPFQGQLDEIQIYRCALAGWQIAQAAGLATGCRDLPGGAIAWWPGEGTSRDSVGANNGTVSGAAFSPGMVGQAMLFDGVDDYVEVPDAPAMNPATITLEAWVNPRTIKAGSRIVSKDLSSGSCSPPYGLWSLDLRAFEGNRAVFHFEVDGTLLNLPCTSVIPLNQFTHLAATFDGATARIFVNGVLENSLSSIGSLPASTAPVVIGNAGAETRACFPGLVEFDGWIDEVTIYNRALTTSEIQSIYNAGPAGKCFVPALRLTRLPGAVRLSWVTNAPGFQLQTNGASLASSAWNFLATTPTVVSGEFVVTNAISSPAQFYRLFRP